MTIPGTIYSAFTTTDVAITAATEKVALTLAGVGTPYTGMRVILSGWAVVTSGTTTTGIIVAVRRGTAITDTLVGEATNCVVGPAAGSNQLVAVAVIDTPGEIAGQSYVLTVLNTGGGTGGAILQSCLTATVVS